MAEFNDIPVRIDGKIVGTAVGTCDPKTGDVFDIEVHFTEPNERLSRFVSKVKPGDFSIVLNAKVPSEPTKFEKIQPKAVFLGVNDRGWCRYKLTGECLEYESKKLDIWTVPGATKVASEDVPHTEILKTLGVQSQKEVLKTLGYEQVLDPLYIRGFTKDQLLACIAAFEKTGDDTDFLYTELHRYPRR